MKRVNEIRQYSVGKRLDFFRCNPDAFIGTNRATKFRYEVLIHLRRIFFLQVGIHAQIKSQADSFSIHRTQLFGTVE